MKYGTHIETKGAPETAVAATHGVHIHPETQQTRALVGVAVVSRIKETRAHSREQSRGIVLEVHLEAQY